MIENTKPQKPWATAYSRRLESTSSDWIISLHLERSRRPKSMIFLRPDTDTVAPVKMVHAGFSFSLLLASDEMMNDFLLSYHKLNIN